MSYLMVLLFSLLAPMAPLEASAPSTSDDVAHASAHAASRRVSVMFRRGNSGRVAGRFRILDLRGRVVVNWTRCGTGGATLYLSPGRYRYEARARGFRPRSSKFNVHPRRDRVLPITLKKR